MHSQVLSFASLQTFHDRGESVHVFRQLWRDFCSAPGKSVEAKLFQRVMQTFCDPEKYVLPVLEVNGGLKLNTDISLDSLSIEQWQTLLDPRRLSETLFAHLGLQYVKTEYGPKVTREVTEVLMTFLKGLSPISSLASQSLLEEGAERIWLATARSKSAVSPPNLPGKFFRFTSRPRVLKESFGKQQRVFEPAIFEDLGALVRGKGHEKGESERRFLALSGLQGKANSVGQALWCFNAMTLEGRARVLDDLVALIAESEKVLSKPVLLNHRSAKVRIMGALHADLSKESIHSSRSAMRLGGASNDLKAGTHRIRGTSLVNYRDFLKIVNLYLCTIDLFKSANEKLQTAEDRSELQALVMREGQKRDFFGDVTAANIEAFFTSLGFSSKNLDALQFHPYKTFAGLISELKKQITGSIKASDEEKALEQFRKLKSVTWVASQLLPDLLAFREAFIRPVNIDSAGEILTKYCHAVNKALKDPVNGLILQSFATLPANLRRALTAIEQKWTGKRKSYENYLKEDLPKTVDVELLLRGKSHSYSVES